MVTLTSVWRAPRAPGILKRVFAGLRWPRTGSDLLKRPSSNGKTLSSTNRCKPNNDSYSHASPVIEPSLLDLLRLVRDSITALGDEFGHVKARTKAIEQRLADVEAVLLQRRARGGPPLEDALQLFERLKVEMAATKQLSPPFGALDKQRERLLSALPPRDRKIVERLIAEHPTLTAWRAIEGLTAFGRL